MPSSEEIWNRAAGEHLPSDARPGDRALHDALELHGLVMNGGLDHALDVLGRDAERAAAGWEHLGGADVAALIRDALATVPDMPDDSSERSDFFVDGWTEEQAERVEELGERYDTLDAEEHALENAFLRHPEENPDDFAP